MATLYARRGTNLYAQWTDNSRTPRRKRHALNTTDRALAQQMLDRADAAYRLGSYDPWLQPISVLEPERPADPISVADAAAAFLSDRADDYAPLTVSTYRSVLHCFGLSVGPAVPLGRLTVSDLTAFVRAPGIARGTTNTRVGVLSALYEWAIEAGHVDGGNLAREIKRPRVRATAHAIVEKAATAAEVEAICSAVAVDHKRRLSSANPSERCPRLWMAAAFRFAFYTGLRASEISRLTWNAVDLDAGTIAITVQKNKGADVLPLATPALAILRDLAETASEGYVFRSEWQRKAKRDHRGFSVNLNREFTTYRDLAEITRPLTFHSLRHGFASHLAAKGKSAWLIQKACRHSSITVSQVYVSLQADTLRSELEDVF